MKSIKAVFVLLILIAIFSSCQKEYTNNSASPISPGNTPADSSSARVKTYTEDVTLSSGHEAVTFTLSYDAQGRISNMTSITSPGDRFVYDYSDKTFSVDIFNLNKLSIHSVYFINSFSDVDSSFQYNDEQDTTTEKYLYNSSHQLIQLKDYDYSAASGSALYEIHYYSYDNNENLLKDSAANSTITYEYYNDLLDKLAMGNVYLRQNKNLVKKTTFSAGNVSETINHTYTFDNYNHLTNEKAVASSGGVVIKSYTY